MTVSANAQPGSITLTGTVQRVGTRTLDVWEYGPRESGTWMVGNAGAFRAGQEISGTGTEDRRGHFYPSRVTVIAMQNPNTIVLRGTVQRVGTHTLAVWESGRHETGTWIVPNAGAYRVGERVSASGTEDRYGHFYPNSISIL